MNKIRRITTSHSLLEKCGTARFSSLEAHESLEVENEQSATLVLGSQAGKVRFGASDLRIDNLCSPSTNATTPA